MKVVRIFGLILSMTLLSTFQACIDDDDDDDTWGNWIRVAPIEGSARSGAVVFTIGETAYVGLGYGNDNQYFNNFYAYNATNGTWRRIKDFPGTARELAVGFSLDGLGYIGLGYNRRLTKKELGDFWKYDPDTDEWTQLNDFPDGPRYSSVSFAFETSAFVGAGFDGTDVRGDFWQYNPGDDSWTNIATNPGEKKEGAFTFIINGKGYYGGGRNNGSSYSTDFWEFNPEAKTWTKRTPSSDEDYYDEFSSAVRRHDAVAFTIFGNGYVATGNSGSINSKVYEYEPVTGKWTEKTDFEGSSRLQAVAFAINNRAFVGTGFNGSRRTDDFWEFRPFDDYDDED